MDANTLYNLFPFTMSAPARLQGNHARLTRISGPSAAPPHQIRAKTPPDMYRGMFILKRIRDSKAPKLPLDPTAAHPPTPQEMVNIGINSITENEKTRFFMNWRQAYSLHPAILGLQVPGMPYLPLIMGTSARTPTPGSPTPTNTPTRRGTIITDHMAPYIDSPQGLSKITPKDTGSLRDSSFDRSCIIINVPQIHYFDLFPPYDPRPVLRRGFVPSCSPVIHDKLSAWQDDDLDEGTTTGMPLETIHPVSGHSKSGQAPNPTQVDGQSRFPGLDAYRNLRFTASSTNPRDNSTTKTTYLRPSRPHVITDVGSHRSKDGPVSRAAIRVNLGHAFTRATKAIVNAAKGVSTVTKVFNKQRTVAPRTLGPPPGLAYPTHIEEQPTSSAQNMSQTRILGPPPGLIHPSQIHENQHGVAKGTHRAPSWRKPAPVWVPSPVQEEVDHPTQENCGGDLVVEDQVIELEDVVEPDTAPEEDSTNEDDESED